MNMESAVRVIDGVFSADATAALRAHALRTSRLDTELAAFYERGAPTNSIETGLDSFLAQVGDAGRFVEYWRRSTWAHVALHRDIDEKLARSGVYEHPTHGHVLYLDVGPLVRAPTTVLWRDGGGQSFLTTVPAVRGRVVRFNGSLLHAVPRPHDAWLAHTTLAPGLERNYSLLPPEAPERRRDVLLFNVWAERPPSGIERGLAADEPASPLVLAEPEELWEEQLPRVLTKQSSSHSQSSGEEQLPRVLIEPAAPHKVSGAMDAMDAGAAPEATRLRLDLMGDCVRRGMDERVLELRTHVTNVSAAFGTQHEALTMHVHLVHLVHTAGSAVSSSDVGAPSGASDVLTKQSSSHSQSSGASDMLDASVMTAACKKAILSPYWSVARQAELLKLARGGGDGIAPVLDELRAVLGAPAGDDVGRRTLAEDAPSTAPNTASGTPPDTALPNTALDRALAEVPNELILELGTALLDQNDVRTAVALFAYAVGPSAARISAVLARGPSGGSAVYAARGALLDTARGALLEAPATTPSRAYTEIREIMRLAEPAVPPTYMEVASACATRACSIGGWSHAAGHTVERASMRDFVEGLGEACADLPVRLSKRSNNGGIEKIRIQRNGAWGDTIELGRFLGQPRPGVFVHEAVGLEELPSCRAHLAKHYAVPVLVPLMAAGGPTVEAGGPRLTHNLAPLVALTAHHGAHVGGLSMRARGLVVVVHKGQLEVSILPLSAWDVAVYLYPEQVLADRWNGSTDEELEALKTTRVAHDGSACAVQQSAFPSVEQMQRLPASDSKRFPLLARGYAARLSKTIQAGDVLWVPACTPYQLSPTEPVVFTSIEVGHELGDAESRGIGHGWAWRWGQGSAWGGEAHDEL